MCNRCPQINCYRCPQIEPPKMVEQVSNLITAHIVQGNDIKVLALPEESDASEEDEPKSSDIGEDLRKESTAARRALREIPPEAQQKLLETYGKFDDNVCDT